MKTTIFIDAKDQLCKIYIQQVRNWLTKQVHIRLKNKLNEEESKKKSIKIMNYVS